MQFEGQEPGVVAVGDQGRMVRLGAGLIAGGFAAAVIFNIVMARLGYEWPYILFLFRPNDRWADFFKLVFSYPGDPLHPPVRVWAFQELIDLLKTEADAYRGTSINPDHMPPLPMLLAVLARRAFSLFDPVVVFLSCLWVALISFASTLTAFAARQSDRLLWVAAGLLSYPFCFLVDRGHFFSLICAITLMSGTRRMITSRQMDWHTIILLAIACNFRPNAVLVPVMLVLGGQAGSFRDLVKLGFCGAAVLASSMLAAHLLYPHYGPATWIAGLHDYNTNYIKSPLNAGWVSSLPSLLNFYLGASPLWSVMCLALAAIAGALTLIAARTRQMPVGQILFLTLGMMVIAVPSFGDYHLLPFLLPVIYISSRSDPLQRSDWIAFLASVLLLIPKNYVFGNDDFWHAWSYQIVINPLVTLAAMVAVLVLAFRVPRLVSTV